MAYTDDETYPFRRYGNREWSPQIGYLWKRSAEKRSLSQSFLATVVLDHFVQ